MLNNKDLIYSVLKGENRAILISHLFLDFLSPLQQSEHQDSPSLGQCLKQEKLHSGRARNFYFPSAWGYSNFADNIYSSSVTQMRGRAWALWLEKEIRSWLHCLVWGQFHLRRKQDKKNNSSSLALENSPSRERDVKQPVPSVSWLIGGDSSLLRAFFHLLSSEARKPFHAVYAKKSGT